MNTPANSCPVLLAFIVLLMVHTAVSYGTCRWMAKPTLLWETGKQPPVETTTPKQEARGEKSFEFRKKAQLFSSVPIPVLCYAFTGYAGLGLAAIWEFVVWFRQGYP